MHTEEKNRKFPSPAVQPVNLPQTIQVSDGPLCMTDDPCSYLHLPVISKVKIESVKIDVLMLLAL